MQSVSLFSGLKIKSSRLYISQSDPENALPPQSQVRLFSSVKAITPRQSAIYSWQRLLLFLGLKQRHFHLQGNPIKIRKTRSRARLKFYYTNAAIGPPVTRKIMYPLSLSRVYLPFELTNWRGPSDRTNIDINRGRVVKVHTEHI